MSSPQPQISTLKLNPAEFQRLSLFVKKNFGIVLSEDKKELVKTRLSRRILELGLSDYRSYFDRVMVDKHSDELTIMMNALSTNLTYFYREEKHFEFLRQVLMPDIVQEKGGSVKKIRAWCTASSSGEEPYTITMEVLESAHQLGCHANQLDFKLLATDISTDMLQKAQRGIYRQGSVDKIPQEQLSRYFQRGKGTSQGSYRIKEQIKSLIRFKYLNLVEPFPMGGPLDFIFCRNVMIYFDLQTQQDIVQRMSKLLKPGGYLFMGMSEGLSMIEHPLNYIKPSIYQKAKRSL